MANVELIQKVLDHITAHPDEWNQASWAVKRECGTAYCFAGHVVQMTGYEIAWDGDYDRAFHVKVKGLPVGLYSYANTISYVARRELGLTDVESITLFDSDNTLSDLWKWANYITKGAIEIPDVYKEFK